jgi:predicted component of viral defense system (DUF524 family)
MEIKLAIYPVERPENIYIVWPKSEELPEGTIQEAKDYRFELKEIDSSDDIRETNLYVDGTQLEALRSPNPNAILWKWSPGFHAGVVTLSLDFPNKKPIFFEIVTDPARKKLTRNDFTTMVSEILQDTHILFSLSGFKVGISRGDGRTIPQVAKLEFLRSRLIEIEKTVKTINDRPIKTLATREQIQPLHKVTRITSQEYLRSMRGGRNVQLSVANRGLAVSYLPARVRKVKKVLGLDIREHRDIKNRLLTWESWLSIISDRLFSLESKNGTHNKKELLWAKRCKIMQRRLNNLLSLPLFSEVKNDSQPMAMSSLYRNIPMYTKFFNLNRDIESGVSNILGDFLNLSLSRTFDLYEIWAFIRLARAAIDMFDLKMSPKDLFRPSLKDGILKITPENAVINLGNGFSLMFQKRYKEFWRDEAATGSYSREMIPDISLFKGKDKKGKTTKLVVLDAKYRIKSGLNDAISSIHMYRDALVEGDDTGSISAIVVGAYLLTPHKPDINSSWKKSGMPGRLFHPAYRGNFNFGALTLYPGMPLEDVQDCLKLILKDIGKA